MIESDIGDEREARTRDWRACVNYQHMKMRKLHLGCGKEHKEGWTNVDSQARLKPDLLVDLTVFPWPWDTDSIDEIYSCHVFEHLPNTVKTMQECYRILKPGVGTLECVVPFGLGYTYLSDPTHCRSWTTSTVEYFTESCTATGYCEEKFKLVFNRLLSNGINSDDRKTTSKKTFRLFLRNLIPFRKHLQWVLLGMYDEVHFKLRKPMSLISVPVGCDQGIVEQQRRMTGFYK